jgi:3-oxoacyl-[acyl-carrier protein] reductase
VFRKIINITSVSGTMGNSGQANYSSGKAGVTGLTKTVAKEWGQFKVNVNAVAFGFVETRLTQAKEKGEKVKAGESGPEVTIGVPEQMRQMASIMIPLGRPAQPEEAAGPILFLASPLSNYVHGQIVNVTGGQFGGMYT